MKWKVVSAKKKDCLKIVDNIIKDCPETIKLLELS